MKFQNKMVVLLLSLSLSASAQTETDSSKFIRIFSYNILHGATTNGDFDLDAIADVINSVDPDLVALQEVDFKTNRAKEYDLATELGWRTKMASIFGKAMSYDGGEYGEAVLSKYSLISSRNVPLPHQPNSEPRAALEVTTELTSGDTITFIGTHLDHLKDETDRISQAQKINEVFVNNRYPTILAGDLNATPTSSPMLILKSVWTPTDAQFSPSPTYPSINPSKKIDYILYRPKDSWRVVKTKVVCDPIGSDHCGYLVVLQLRN